MQKDSNNSGTLSVVEAFFAALNAHDRDALLATVHPDIHYRFHAKGFAPVRGLDEMALSWDAILATFPDFHEDMLEVTVRDDLAVVRWRLSGSLTGPIALGDRIVVPDSAQPSFAIEGVDVITVRDGLIITKDTYADLAPWHAQYGHLPEYAPGAAA